MAFIPIMKRVMMKKGFTLIELLIVVAIIAILAAIAIPNFLQAQTRAKVSRTTADMRTIVTALEAYSVDHNEYPLNDGNYNVIPRELSTPVSYLADAKLVDVYSDKEKDPVHGDLVRYFTYTRYVTLEQVIAHSVIGHTPPIEAVDSPGFNEGAFQRHGYWKLVSNGPDRQYSRSGDPQGVYNPNPMVLMGCDIPYDPTNGVDSFGNIIWTQKNPPAGK